VKFDVIKSTLGARKGARRSALLKEGESFKIPSYQREFSWKQKNFEQLWTDLNNHLKLVKREKTHSDYLMGPISTERLKNRPKTFEIADGQQRLTTLFILLAASRTYIGKDQEKKVQKVLLSKKSAPRIVLDNPEEQKYLVEILAPGESSKRTKSKYREAHNFFYDKFKKLKNKNQAKEIVNLVLHHVTFVSVTASVEGFGLQQFIRANTRGLPLDLRDKIKAIVIGSVKPTDAKEVEQAKKDWIEIIENFGDKKKFSDALFKNWYFSEYPKNSKKASELTIMAHLEELFESKRGKTLKSLKKYAKTVADVREGNFPGTDKPCLALVIMQNRGKFKQLRSLLWAAGELPRKDFNALAESVLKTMCVHQWTSPEPQYVEKTVDELLDHLHLAVRGPKPARRREYEKVLDGLKTLRNKEKAKFAVCILNYQYEKKKEDRHRFNKKQLTDLWFLIHRYLKLQEDSNYQHTKDNPPVHHILAQKATAETRRVYGEKDWKRDVQRFGNLTPLRKVPNSGIQNKPLSDKEVRDLLKLSEYLITSSLVEKAGHPNKKVKKLVTQCLLPVRGEWSRKALKKRSIGLYELIAVVLDFDPQKNPQFEEE